MVNIFTEKAVGIAFAAAFALWAWMLNNMAETVMSGVRELRTEQVALQAQIASLRSEIVTIQVRQAEDVTYIRERQNGVLQRLDMLESGHHENPGNR